MSLALIVAFLALMIAVIPVAHALVIASGVASWRSPVAPCALVANRSTVFLRIAGGFPSGDAGISTR